MTRLRALDWRLLFAIALLVLPASACRGLQEHTARLDGAPRVLSSAAAAAPAAGSAPRAAADPALSRAAEAAGMALPALMQLLAADRDVTVDRASGRLVYSCSGLTAPGQIHLAGGPAAAAARAARFAAAAAAAQLAQAAPQRTAAAGAGGASAAPGGPDPADLDAAFRLHSRPGAPRRILLDFNGYTATGTAWNNNPLFANQSVIAAPPYSLDDDPTFCDGEKLIIIQIWRTVAEDFAPWDVDVTTEDDGTPLKGIGHRAVIGGDSVAVLNATNPGLTMRPSFGDPFYGPSWIFPGDLEPAWVANLISHEVGHSLGLTHAVDGPEPYYRGHGNWAPIMGAGYMPIVQWTDGSYPGSPGPRDDLGDISKYLQRRSDDHGGTSETATAVPAAPLPAASGRSAGAVGGTIEWTGDQDWFHFDADAGKAALEIDITPRAPAGWFPAFLRADLDAAVTITEAATGRAVLALDPQGSLLSGAYALTLPAAGRYIVAIRGASDGDLETGYPAYGSLGDYRLLVSFPTPGAGSNDTRADPVQPGAPPPPGPSPLPRPSPRVPPGPAPAPVPSPVPAPSPDPGDPNGLRIKVAPGYVMKSSKGRVRVTKLRLVVTDRGGTPAAGAVITYTWSHIPGDGSGTPSFPDLKLTATAGTGGARAGAAAAAASPKAAGGWLRLTIDHVAPALGAGGAQPGGGGGSVGWNRAQSDVTKDFAAA